MTIGYLHLVNAVLFCLNYRIGCMYFKEKALKWIYRLIKIETIHTHTHMHTYIHIHNIYMYACRAYLYI